MAVWIREMAPKFRSRTAVNLSVFARLQWVRMRNAASRAQVGRLSARVQPVPRAAMALAILTTVSGATALLSAPTVTTLLPPATSRDAMADRIARAEDSSSRQQAEIADLTVRLTRLTEQHAATATVAAQAADAAAQLETLHHDLGITAERLRQDVASLRESLARISAQHSSDQAQLTATLGRITSLADSLTTALTASSVPGPATSQTPRPAAKSPSAMR